MDISRSHKVDRRSTEQPLQNWVFKHPDFAGRVGVEYRHRLQLDDAHDNPISRLLMLKQSIRYVHDNLVSEGATVVADNVQDQLGWALILVRALENRNFERANKAVQGFPRLGTCGSGKICERSV